MRPGLKIITMSGRLAGPLLEAATDFGAMASIAKPIQPDELLDVVDRVLYA
jgi:DNA-binding NtrC family response regulator